ncbi:hypothetical protein EVG20_g7797 [Dentipellis fragilis]|uniref:F-box domain-containing protein n=1 Tax=Dentipellis fragilis TaxID=205917 RepID=A0A4Y9YA16_9AGAM|nr:hypothetical protein EVG20_g7797 [Dentipellis fragilis]
MLLVNSPLSAVEYWDKAERDRFTSQHGSIVIKTPDIPDAREELEVEMKAVELVMSTLRTRYNSLALVNRLPSEVLAHIFQYFHDDCLLEYTRTFLEPRRAVQCVNLTHVCRRWRIVAIDHPGLWDHILVGTKSTDEFLRRSCREPIMITYDSWKHWLAGPRAHDMEYTAGIISQNLSRVLSLRLTGSSEELTALLPALRDSMPVLEEAFLNISSFGQNTIPVPSLPSDLFKQSVPRLHHLSLEGWTVPYGGEVGEFGGVLSALSRMPLLEVFHLKHVLPPPRLHAPWRPIDGPKQVVPLPSLAKLSWPAWPVHAISNSEGLPAGKLLFDLVLDGQPDELYTRGEMERFFDALPLEHVQILRICYKTESPFSDWSGIFCGSTNLWHISIECEIDYDAPISAIEQLLAIDLSPRRRITSPPFPPPAFPSLQSLTLRGIDFGHDEAVHDKLLTWLGRWGPIKKLILKYNIINTALIDRLKALPFELIIYRSTINTGLEVAHGHSTQVPLPSITWPPEVQGHGL